MPLPIKGSRGTLAVQAQDGHALFTWDAEFEVLDPSQETEVTGLVNGYYQQTMETFKRVVEARERDA